MSTLAELLLALDGWKRRTASNVGGLLSDPMGQMELNATRGIEDIKNDPMGAAMGLLGGIKPVGRGWNIYTQGEGVMAPARRLGEGPFAQGSDALEFGKSEVGVPYAVSQEGARKWRIHVRGDTMNPNQPTGKWSDLGETFSSMRDALNFLESEVGVPGYVISQIKKKP